MRRATHLYCRYCKTNLCDYGAERCDYCHIRLTRDLLTFDPSEPMSLCLRLKCLADSWSFRVKNLFSSCGEKASDGV